MKRWLGFGLVAVLAIAGCTAKQPKTPVPPVVSEPKPPDPKATEPKAPEPKAPDPKAPEPQVTGNCAASTADALTKPGIVSVFFTCTADTMSFMPRAVERRVPEKGTELKVALEELLKGPTEQEHKAGFTSFFGPDTAGMLKTVTVSQAGRAVVDFADFSAKLNNASTSAGTAQLTGELNKTVFQFKEIKEVEYRFDGNCERFWTWLQRDCHAVKAAEASN